MEEASKEIEQNSKKVVKPTEAEVTQEEVDRTTRPVENQEAQKEMEAYAAAHPEEAEEAKKKSLDSKKK
jgi:tagatose-1,6-bisphosphate aldolase